jgi:glycosyltransferase involved in cell wall biosynthesis
MLAEARDKGLRRSARAGFGILRTQIESRVEPRKCRFVFLSSTVDNTGAPQVLVDLIEDLATRYEPRRMHVVAPAVMPEQLRRLTAAGVRVDGVALRGEKLVRLQLALRKDDHVLLNTLAVRADYQRAILASLRAGDLAHAFWFIHEDTEQLPRVAPSLLDSSYRRELRRLIDSHALTFLVPSAKTKREYQELLDTEGVKSLSLRVAVPESYRHERSQDDYTKLRFLISGAPHDGRKAQLIALAAFSEFLLSSFQRNPRLYRPFCLVLVGVGDDFVSRQIREVGPSVLGHQVEIHPPVPREQALEIASTCNVVMCCSFNETFSLFVAEGMAMGHVLLRNDCAGVDEQLAEGLNGFRIDSNDIRQMAGVFERVLNRATTSDALLQAMGRRSQDMAASFGNNSYLDQLELLEAERLKTVRHGHRVPAHPGPDTLGR